MGLAFPLSLAEFFDRLRIATMGFSPSDPFVTSRTRGGELLTAQVGTILWQGSVRLLPDYHAEAAWVQAMLAYLRRTGGAFLATPGHYRGPSFDPGGVMLGTSAPQIDAFGAAADQVRLRGLPPGYVLATGDLLSFAYGPSLAQRACHQVVWGGAAAGDGKTPLLTVAPALRPGALVGAGVELVRPVIKARLSAMPGYGNLGPLMTDGLFFDFVQALD